MKGGQKISLEKLETAWFRGGGSQLNTLSIGNGDGRSPLRYGHFHLDAFTRMRVDRAMQIFGDRAHWVLQTYGIGPLSQQLDLMRVVNDAVDVLNSKPGADICALDRLFTYMNDWQTETKDTPKLGLPTQLFIDLKNLATNMKRLREVVGEDVQFSRVNQDVCENHFNSARHCAGGSQAINARDANTAAGVSTQVRALRTMSSNKGNSSKSPFRVDVEPIALVKLSNAELKCFRY